jgi:hypothetical protein
VDFFATPAKLGIELTRTVNYTNGNFSAPVIETCNGTTVCNFPDVWSKASQEKAAGSGSLNSSLMKVVLPKTIDAVLYFQVSSPYLTANANSTVAPCLAPPPASTRRLLADNTSYVVSTPGVMSFSVKIGDGAPVAGTVVGTNGGKLLIPRDLYMVSGPDAYMFAF